MRASLLASAHAGRHGLACEPLAQRAGPRLDGIGTMRQDAELALLAVRDLHTKVVLGISPIEANEGSKVGVGVRLRDSTPEVLQ